MKRLLYLSAGSSKWGIGHLRRSSELIDILRKKKVNVDAVALIPNSADIQNLRLIVRAYDRCINSLGEISSADVDGIIVDVNTDFQPELLPWLQQQKLFVFALDWYHEAGGVVIAKANLRGGKSALRYCIIRKEFHDVYLKHRGISPRYDAVVVLGGGDGRGYLPKIFRLFADNVYFSNKNIVIVLGPMIEDELVELVDKSMGSVTVLKCPNNIADIMVGAAAGITNGGTSLMEFTVLGVPTLIFPQSDEEDDFIEPFLENGCSVMGSLEPNEFSRQVMELWEDEAIRKRRSVKARELIDGQGADRIAGLIFKTFFGGISENESYSYKKV